MSSPKPLEEVVVDNSDPAVNENPSNEENHVAVLEVANTEEEVHTEEPVANTEEEVHTEEPVANTEEKVHTEEPVKEEAVNIIIEEVKEKPKQHPIITSIAGKVKEIMINKMTEIENEHSILYVLRITMECIEVHDLEGINKKDLAESVVKKLIDESKLDDQKKQFCIQLVDAGVMGQTMDLVVSATKGELNINKKTKRKIMEKLSSCLSFCKR